MKDHQVEFALQHMQFGAQALSNIAQGLAVMNVHLASLVAQGERLDTVHQDEVPVTDGDVVGDLGYTDPAGKGFIRITAADGNPIHPRLGSVFKMDDDYLLVAVSQEFYNQHEETINASQ